MIAATDQTPDTLTVADVAAELRVSERKVYELLRSRDLPGYRVGNLWRVERGDLEAWKRMRRAR